MSSLLRYPPPTQVAPTTSEVPANENFYGPTFGAEEDVIVKLPAAAIRKRGIEVKGGRNIRIIGGTVQAKDATQSAIRIKECTGSVFMEGVRVNVAGFNVDGVDIGGNTSGSLKPDVYMQNCRLEGTHGTAATTHADAYQPQAAISNLYVDKVSVRAQYQGFFIRPQFAITSAHLNRMDFAYEAGGDPVTYLLWLASESETPYPVFLSEVYVEPRATQNLIEHAVWPKTGQKNGSEVLIGAETSDAGATAHWPEAEKVTGFVTRGTPPEGEFVPTTAAGFGYVSPGYMPTEVPSLPLGPKSHIQQPEVVCVG